MAAGGNEALKAHIREMLGMPPGEIALQEVIVAACFQVVVLGLRMNERPRWGSADDAARYLSTAREELREQLQALRSMVPDDSAAWSARVARLQRDV